MIAPTPLTDAELAELRARAEAATPGEWERPSFPQDHRIVARQGSAEQTIAEVRWVPPTWATRGANADFIALANPATVLRLLDELQRLRDALDSIEMFMGDDEHPPIITEIQDAVRAAFKHYEHDPAYYPLRARHERMLAQANAEWAARGDTGEENEP